MGAGAQADRLAVTVDTLGNPPSFGEEVAEVAPCVDAIGPDAHDLAENRLGLFETSLPADNAAPAHERFLEVGL
jgi:hypothetical protein